MSPASVLRIGAASVAAPIRSVLARGVLDADARVGVVDHLDELRRRLIASLVAVGAAFCVAFAWHGELIALLNAPLAGGPPVTLGITEPFFTALKVSAFAAFLAAFPVLMWNVWRYI